MPNQSPQEWTAAAAAAAQPYPLAERLSLNPGFPCSNGTCVDIKPDGDDFRFTSTISEEKGSVLYNRDELVQFFGDVKAGKWDHLLA